ncbi:MlrC C-terminal domain-containing protein [Thermocatellispora tengchongensis]|uniref:MlrC C-terminal domain-containing protein n=1 Tax=Thermocatellispora tengchongensis TaxID=1073253 RepID=UPI003634F158
MADASDDPGGGGSGDGTYLLRAIRNRGIRACFATLYDPAAVARATEAGVGAVADFELGGRHGKTSGEPLRVRAKVRAITDGRVSHADVRRGRYADFGRSVRLSADGLELIVASRRLPVLDPEIFLLHGVLPERFPLVGVKAAHHFKSGFAHLGARLVTADAPGLTSRRIAELPEPAPAPPCGR